MNSSYDRCFRAAQHGSLRRAWTVRISSARYAQLLTLALYLACLLLPGLTAAQADRESILKLTVDQQRISGEWSVALDSLDASLELDTDHDGDVTWGEIRSRRSDIERYLGEHLQIVADGTSTVLQFNELVYGMHGGEPSIRSHFSGEATQNIGDIGIGDALSSTGLRCRLRLQFADAATVEAVITQDSGLISFNREMAKKSEFGRSVMKGMQHIWHGYDHILFLLVLLVPAVFQRTANGRESVSSFARSLKQVLIVVSAFTVAHSLTLTLAALQLVQLPSRLVETAIAISVLLAALHNFLPKTAGTRSAWLACGFGLLHGFGFAGFLSDSLQGDAPVVPTLIGFNVGVELGQLAIVAIFLPLAYLLRNTRFYRIGLLYGGSSVACCISLFWIWGRAF